MEDPDAIAIVGVGCRLPGAESLDDFWGVLSNGENHVIDIPKDRWNVDAFYDADPDAPGKTYVRKVGIVKNHDMFDNRLFDVNDIEAAKMDPQQRFVLESTFMALENGGFPRSQMSGSNTGVFMGLMNSDYTDILAADMDQTDNYTLTGGAASIAAARISYVFNLLGPALAIDTACSSALIAIHLASQALQMGDCNMAICGGVNCIMLPSVMIPLSKARMVSPTGSSKAFSAEADGYARGEGCGVVVLKKVSDAVSNGDKIWAIIKTASNQDGRMASPITAPSGQQQQLLLQETYPRYGIDPHDIQVIEAHGTGTPVGDPIEANSLGNYFGGDGTLRFIGSVKTNIGHLEAAAGIAGLVKVLLMMKKTTIVPSLHFVNPNPKIDFENFNFKVPTECYPWEPLPDGRRMACVNSFGFGGSNGHAIVIQPPSFTNKPSTNDNGHTIIAISGYSKEALKANVSHLIKSLSVKDVNPKCLSFTTTCRRDHYNHRVAVPISKSDDWLQELKKATQGSVDKFSTARKKMRLVYVFGGMGTTWNGMCKEIMSKEILFLQTIREIDLILRNYCTVSVEEEIENQRHYTHPMIGPLMLFACQVALYAVWKAWGVKPHAIVGQSVGEVAAAYASGRLSLADAVMVIFYRTELLATATGGKMLAILNYLVSDVEKMCAKYEDRVNVALYYSPNACAISGHDDCVDAIHAELQEAKQDSSLDISLIKLNVTTAFHSERMDSLMHPLEEKLKGIESSIEQTMIFSTVTGKVAQDRDFVTPNYWAQNLRQPVLFHQALSEVRNEDFHTVFIEIGPKPVLRAHLENIFGDEGVEILPSMEKGTDLNCMLKSLCELYAIGFNPLWENIICQSDREITDEPKYQFQRRKLFYEPDISRRYRDGTEASIKDHPFVNRIAGIIPTFKVNINERQTPFVFEHVVNGVILVPGTLYAEVAYVVGSVILRMPPQTLSISAYYIQPLAVQSGQEYVLTCQVQNVTSTKLAFTVYKQNSIYAHGHAEKRETKMTSTRPIFAKLKSRCKTVRNHDEIYKGLAKFGFHYGEGLAILRDSVSNTTEALATIQCSKLINSQMYQTHFHPSVLDAMTQTISTMVGDDGSIPEAEGKQILPAGLGLVTLCQSLEENMLCYAKVMKTSKSRFLYNILLLTTAGVLVAEVKDFVIKIVGENNTEVERVSYKLGWILDPEVLPKDVDDDQQAVVICDDNSTLQDYVGTSEKFIFTSCKTSSNNLDIEEVKNAILLTDNSNTSIKKKEIAAIVFDQGSRAFNEDLTPDDIFFTICQTCNNLRDLLVVMSEHDMTIPVTVLTRATQSLSGTTNGNVVNIFGSQLWGMVRSMIKEDLYPYVQLLDISDTSLETLATLVEYITDRNITAKLEKEILIHKGKAYTSVVKFSRETEPSLLAVEQKWNGDDEVRIVQPSDQQNEFCLYHSQESRPENGHAMVFMQNVLLHKESIFPITVAGNSSIWNNISTNEPQLVCLEAQGYQKDSTGCREIILCLPVPVSNIVNVPNECIVPLSAVPCYQVGLMTLLIFTWQIYDTIDRNSLTFFVTDDSSIKCAQVMKRVLFLFGKENTECLSKNDIENIKVDKNITIVLLTDLEPKELNKFVESSKLQQIIGIDGFNGYATLENCYQKQSTAPIVRIEPKQVFHLSRISKTLPRILNKISKSRIKFEHLFRSINEEHFAGFSYGSLDLEDKHQFKLMTTEESLFRRNASYLVVGGLGGLGWLTVGLIAEMGGGLVATLSRSQPSEEMEIKIENLKKDTGVEITCLQADISDEISLQKALNVLSIDFPQFPLRGIFQGAGVLDDAFLLRMTKESFDRVCLPKILGTYNLHKVSLDVNLDYFVMHSSIASITGNAGQTNYAAGNSFMDTFAHYRRFKGFPGQSINWGPLELGMALNNEQIAQQLKKIGFVSLTEEQIKRCLVYSLLTNATQICYMDFDWIEKQRHLYLALDIRPIMMNGGIGLDEDDVNVRQIDLAAIKLLPPAERFDAIFDYLKEVIGQVLSIDPDDVQKGTELSSLGLDSMLAMTLVNQIRRDFYVRVPIVKLLDEKTVEILVSFLDSSLMSDNDDLDDIESDSANFFKLELSPFQEMVCHGHRTWNGKRDILFGAEIYLTIPASLDWMKDVIISILRRHKALRTIFVTVGDITRPQILEDLSHLEIIPLHSDDPNDVRIEILKVSEKPFDLSKELPIRIICGYAKGQYNLGFVFHSICFDLKSIYLFFQDFREANLLKMSQSTFPPLPDVNVPYEMQSVLSPRMEEMESFWDTRINNQTRVPLISFSAEGAKSEDVSGYHDYVIDDLTTDKLSKIDYILSKWNVTLFQFLTSAYQLLLHLISGETTVGVRTAVDTRMHIPKLQNVITRCVNGIPLVSNVNPLETIRNFATSNCRDISRCVFNGLYPCNKIMEKTTAETKSNIFRHSVVSEDMTGLQSVSTGLGEFKFSYYSNGPLNINHETRLLIWSKKDVTNVRLQIDYLPHLVTEKKAKGLLNSLFILVEYMVSNPLVSIKNIPSQMFLTAITNEPSTTMTSISMKRQNGLSEKMKVQNNYPIESQSKLVEKTESIRRNGGNPKSKAKDLPNTTKSLNGISHSPEDKNSNGFSLSKQHGETQTSKAESKIIESLKNKRTPSMKSSDLDPQLKAVLSGPILKMNNDNYDRKQGASSYISQGSHFMKATKQGWGHTVFMKLDENSLKWGPSENCLEKQIPLETIQQISLNAANVDFTLIIKTRSRRFYFSTTNKDQAKSWMTGLKEILDTTVSQSPKMFVMSENFMLY